MLDPRSRDVVRAVLVALVLFASFAARADDKVVFQVSDADEAKWNLALGNARNLQKGTESTGGADVEIVAYGPGIQLLKVGSPIAAKITDARDNRIRVVACKNTMAAAKLTEADMLPDIGFVPSGVVEVMRRQQQGYAYIRP